MSYRLISGDTHIDMTYCPGDLWSSRAPAKWKSLAPHVQEKEDGLHWFMEGRDLGMWNGIGPVFMKYQAGAFARFDDMRRHGFDWDHRPGARPRPTTPELRLADLDRDGVDAEIVYGCLLLDDYIADLERRAWAMQVYNDWAADFARRSDPRRVFPLAMIPNTDPQLAAAEVRRCARMGLRGGDLPFKNMPFPLYHHEWYPVWEAAAECQFPISFHSTGFTGMQAPRTLHIRWSDNDPKYPTEYRVARGALFQNDGMDVLSSILVSGACQKYPAFRFVLAEAGVTWIPYVLDRLDATYYDRGHKHLNFPSPPSDYFRRQGYTTFPQDRHLAPFLSVIGEDNVIWASDYPHADSGWPESRQSIAKSLLGLSDDVKRKITCSNVAGLYAIS